MLYLPLAFCILWVFLLGLCIGSFLNVLIVRLPFEKSPFWPGSRCFTCFRPIQLRDNLPIIGYLRLGGRCRNCQTPFSARYLWVEVGTGLMFVALFLIEIVGNVHNIYSFKFAASGNLPTLPAWLYFAAHAFLLSMLFAASVIDMQFRIIPTHITYFGALVGIGCSVLFPWPWPSDLYTVPGGSGWGQAIYQGKIPTGLALWPVWEPTNLVPAGSWQMGLLTGIAGALAGMFTIRALKFVFEYGFGQEAVGLGDADLLLMAGAFLGWQPVMLAVPVGAFVTLMVLPLVYVGMKLRRKPFPRHIPFGPGLAAGVVVVWLNWQIFGELIRAVFFQPMLLGFGLFAMLGLLLLAGILLRR